MNTPPTLQFKMATEDSEFEQVHRLNYRTFVEEIPQHERSAEERLVDKFHPENTYLICLSGDHLVGMMAARGKRPFSLDHKLPNLDSYLPPGRRPCEIRLLAVEREFRNGQVFRGLTALLWQFATERGYDLGVISGTTRQLKLYRHMGFEPFGPLVGQGEALFQPMYLLRENFEQKAEELLRPPPVRPEPANFLPGPVAVHDQVRNAFARSPRSHRGGEFAVLMRSVRARLGQLTNAKKVLVLAGTGTLANDAIAAQLSLTREPGLILCNGEFGGRLADQASRFGVGFDRLDFPWGEPFDLAAVEQWAAAHAGRGWLWCAHCETSTGLLNPLPQLKQICAGHGLKLCLDGISSIGLVPVDLRGVWFASGASGKGLAAYPGLSMVFHHHDLSPASNLPRYLDLGWAERHGGVPFTHSSNLVAALDTALGREDWPEKFARLAELTPRLRQQLRQAGLTLITAEAHAAPGVVTFALPAFLNSADLCERLEQAGYLLSYNSDYLRRRNWIQLCLMGEYEQSKLEALIDRLAHALRHGEPSPAAVSEPAGEGESRRD